MNITIVQNNITTVLSNISNFQGATSIALYPIAITKKATTFDIYTSNCSPELQHKFTTLKCIIDRIASFSAILSSTEDEANVNINAFILAFLFVSEKFFSDFSVYVILPQNLYHLFYDFSSFYRESICISNDSDCLCTLTINSEFCELNKEYSSPYSEVYKYNINNQSYAIKLMTNKLSEGNLLFLNTGLHNQNIICNSLFALNLSDTNFKSIVCSEYIEGSIVHSLLSSSQAEELIRSILLASHTMSTIDYTDYQYDTIYEKIKSCINSCKTKQALDIGIVLQEYCYYGISEKSYSQLCFYDLHRENLIISNDNWHIIDTDSIVIGTNTFMFSCLLAASFLLEDYSPLYVSNSVRRFFGKNYERVYFEIMVRLYIGISFFSCDAENSLLFSKYMASLYQFTLHLKRVKATFSNQFLTLLDCLKEELDK